MPTGIAFHDQHIDLPDGAHVTISVHTRTDEQFNAALAELVRAEVPLITDPVVNARAGHHWVTRTAPHFTWTVFAPGAEQHTDPRVVEIRDLIAEVSA